MPNKTYWLKFGPDDPRSYTGLSPTFLVFQTEGGGTLAAPGITERIAGSSGTGLYQFSHESTLSIAFLVDGGATLTIATRYITGVLDPVQAVDNKIGYNTDSFGNASIDPTTVMGFVKRLQEFLEGDANFNKVSGQWTILDRTGGVTLAQKTLTNTSTQATKT